MGFQPFGDSWFRSHRDFIDLIYFEQRNVLIAKFREQIGKLFYRKNRRTTPVIGENNFINTVKTFQEI